ncbi:DUF58 domain-containing protein [Fretibacter rubidus]|uniref:DUF58 domain-containing protein n=1 Tax=Fretibacter rubidus TaxID=570162 RepID=UPI00352B9909
MPVAPLTSQTKSLELRKRAEALAAPYPTLLAEAERVAAVVTQGVHGRRRPGQGETFWQYRNYQSSDSAHRIDWRRSARGDQVYIRENEWEAANTVYFWRDGRPGMDWTSGKKVNGVKLPTKQDRASVVTMALAILLMRAGERCAVMGETNFPRTGRVGLERIAHRLAGSDGPIGNLDADIPSHARLIIASDFLEGADVWRARLAKLSARPAKGILIHIIDPAERDFPYKGRMQLRLPGGLAKSLPPLLVGRAEQAREDYQKRFQAHCDNMAQIARRLDWPLIVHETDKPATKALTAAYAAMAGDAL